MFTYNIALKNFLRKKDTKARLVHWVLHLQEFNLEIKDTIAEPLLLNKSFPNKQLMSVELLQ